MALVALLATAGLAIGLAGAFKPEAFKASGIKVRPSVDLWCGGEGSG